MGKKSLLFENQRRIIQYLLISTDVLSEGLNLQDATRLINYDLHWNPVRLMQRIGREAMKSVLAARERLIARVTARTVTVIVELPLPWTIVVGRAVNVERTASAGPGFTVTTGC